MELTSSNWGDIQKYYENSFVKLREFGDRIFYIDKVNRDEVHFHDMNEEAGVIYLHDAVPYTLDMVLPNKAVYQMGDEAYLLARIPARQYHRGITTGNCKISRLRSTGFTSANLSFATLQGYANKPIYRPLEDVIGRSTGSEAISSRFAYNSANKSIYCDTKVVAVVDKVKKEIKAHSLLLAELKRFLLRDDSNITYKLVGY